MGDVPTRAEVDESGRVGQHGKTYEYALALLSEVERLRENFAWDEVADRRQEEERLMQDNARLRERVAELEKERSTCDACRHVRLFENLSTPCPHCIIEELRRKHRDLEAPDPWHWMGTDEDDLASFSDGAAILIRAGDLRAMKDE